MFLPNIYKEMSKKKLQEITIAQLCEKSTASHIGTDIVFFDDIREMPQFTEAKRLRCLLVALCTEGEAQYSVDTITHVVKKNDIIIISEGPVLDSLQLTADCKGICIALDPEFFKEVVKGVHDFSSLILFAKNHPVAHMGNEEIHLLQLYLRACKQKIDERDHKFRKEVVQSMLTTMIYDISNALFRIQYEPNKRQTRAEIIFAEFIDLVEKNYMTKRRVSWYGKQLCITPKYLSETIKAISRRTPNEWINKYVTMELRSQLKNTTKSIKEIAEEMCFPNQSFLGKYFKEHVGVSPSEYRRS